MTEPFLDDLRMHAGLEGEGRPGMAQVVQTDCGQPEFGGPVPEVARGRIGMKRRPILVREYEAGGRYMRGRRVVGRGPGRDFSDRSVASVAASSDIERRPEAWSWVSLQIGSPRSTSTRLRRTDKRLVPKSIACQLSPRASPCRIPVVASSKPQGVEPFVFRCREEPAGVLACPTCGTGRCAVASRLGLRPRLRAIGRAAGGTRSHSYAICKGASNDGVDVADGCGGQDFSVLVILPPILSEALVERSQRSGINCLEWH